MADTEPVPGPTEGGVYDGETGQKLGHGISLRKPRPAPVPDEAKE